MGSYFDVLPALSAVDAVTARGLTLEEREVLPLHANQTLAPRTLAQPHTG